MLRDNPQPSVSLSFQRRGNKQILKPDSLSSDPAGCLGKFFDVSVSRFPCVQSEDNNSTCRMQSLVVHESSVWKSAWHMAGIAFTG